MTDKQDHTPQSPPVSSYDRALARAVEWLGDRYLLAKPINAAAAAHAGFFRASTSRSTGSRRNLMPVAANSALHSAGGAAVVPVSPIPPGASPLLMR
jgi:hypothetical protein